MSFLRRQRGLLLAAIGAAALAGSPALAEAPSSGAVLRVCADPNNLPFSNEREEGFENRLASLFAKELGARLEYTWWAQRRGFFRNTINARLCDVVMGVPRGIDFVDTTSVLYRSSYVFLTRADAAHQPRSFDDPALRQLKIGVHVIGDDYTNTPPVHALSQRGIVHNLVGFRLAGDYSEPNPPARLIEAVASGAVDVAVVWGPLGGYFASRQRVPLRLGAVASTEGPQLTYDIAIGLRRREPELKASLERVLATRRVEIRKILREFGVPVEAK